VSQKQNEKAEPKERGPRVHYNYRRLKVDEPGVLSRRRDASAEARVGFQRDDGTVHRVRNGDDDWERELLGWKVHPGCEYRQHSNRNSKHGYEIYHMDELWNIQPVGGRDGMFLDKCKRSSGVRAAKYPFVDERIRGEFRCLYKFNADELGCRLY
jgi:hypothetical protein